MSRRGELVGAAAEGVFSPVAVEAKDLEPILRKALSFEPKVKLGRPTNFSSVGRSIVEDMVDAQKGWFRNPTALAHPAISGDYRFSQPPVGLISPRIQTLSTGSESALPFAELLDVKKSLPFAELLDVKKSLAGRTPLHTWRGRRSVLWLNAAASSASLVVRLFARPAVSEKLSGSAWIWSKLIEFSEMLVPRAPTHSWWGFWDFPWHRLDHSKMFGDCQ